MSNNRDQIIDIDELYEKNFLKANIEQCLKKLDNMYIDFDISSIETKKDIEDLLAKNNELQFAKLSILKRLLDERFPHEITIAHNYAEQLLITSLNMSEEKFSDYLDTMRIISEDLFSDDAIIANIYGMLLKRFIVQYNTERESTFDKLKRLYEIRFPNNINIRTLYEESLSYIKDEKTLSNEEIELLLKKVDIFLQERKKEDLIKEKIHKILKILYVDSDLSFEDDDIIEEFFSIISSFYTSLNNNSDKIKFISIRSLEGRVYTISTKEYHAIIWDQSYWDLFSVFCYTLEELINCEKNKGYVNMFPNGQYAMYIIHMLIKKTCYFLGNRYFKTNPDFTECLLEIANTVCKKDEFEIQLKNDLNPLVIYGKLYALFHEVVHVFQNLNENDSEIGFDNFIVILQLCTEYINDLDFKHIHGYSKNEYVNRLMQLIENNEWRDLRSELYNDFMAFYEMIVFQYYCMGKEKSDNLVNALGGSKVFNLFHTYVYMITHVIEISLNYKKKGLYGNDLIKAVNKDLQQEPDEIEFQHVLNRLIEISYLGLNREEFNIDDYLWNEIYTCTDSYIDMYQKSIRKIAQWLIKAIASNFFSK